MKEKERLIMDTSMKLFARKGFSSTSIQEIANEAGISKGSFYLYFKSKEALLMAIFKHYYDTFHSDLEQLKSNNLSPREQFIEQMVTQFSTFLGQKDFIIMHARESAIPFNKDIANIISNMRVEFLESIQQSLSAMYGEKLNDHLSSLTFLVQGISNSFLELLLLDKTTIDIYDLAHFILNRTDDLAQGLVNSDEKPLITKDAFKHILQCPLDSKQISKDDVLQTLQNTKVECIDSGDLLITLEVLEEELQRDNPRMPVIQGMLRNLKEENKCKPLYNQIHTLMQL